MPREIKLGDTVYNNKQGESGWPLKVLEFRTITWHGKEVRQVRTDNKLGGWLGWYALANLTHTPNLRGRREEPRER